MPQMTKTFFSEVWGEESEGTLFSYGLPFLLPFFDWVGLGEVPDILDICLNASSSLFPPNIEFVLEMHHNLTQSELAISNGTNGLMVKEST